VVYPLMYRDYKSHGFTLDWRDSEPAQVGVPPSKAVNIKQFEVYDLSEHEWKQGRPDAAVSSGAYPIYKLSHYVMRDHDELVQKAANHSLRYSNAWITNLLLSQSPY